MIIVLIIILALVGYYYGVKAIASVCWKPYFNKKAKEMHKMIEERKRRGDFNG